MKCSCRVLNPMKAKSSLVTNTRLRNNRVVLLFTSSIHISASHAALHQLLLITTNLLIFRSASPHFQNFFSEVGVISLSSQVRNSFSSLKYIKNFMVQVKSSFRYYKILSTIKYVFVREEFSFDRLYYFYFGIFLNECYVSTLELYQLFGVVNFNY